MIRPLAGLLLLAALGYAALCTWMYADQRRLVYFPEATRADAASTDFALERDGATLRGWVVNPGRARALVYFGGNGEAIESNRELFACWLPGHSIYLVAYRGYGASDGTPSQAVLLDDALAVFDRVRSLHGHTPVGVIGRSLESGVASYPASRRPVSRLALVTPFDSLASVAQSHYPWLPVRWLLREDYDSVRALREYRGPLLVVRAGRDEVVPPPNTDRLIASRATAPEVVALADADHNRLGEAVYGPALTAFFETPWGHRGKAQGRRWEADRHQVHRFGRRSALRVRLYRPRRNASGAQPRLATGSDGLIGPRIASCRRRSALCSRRCRNRRNARGRQ